MTIPAKQATSRPAGSLSQNPGHYNKSDARQTINQLAGSLSPDPKPDNKLDGRQNVARPAGNSVSSKARTKRNADRQSESEYKQSRSDDSESVRWETFSHDDLRQSVLEPTIPETVRDRLHVNRSNTFFERSAEDAISSRGRPKNESTGDQLVERSVAKRSTALKELDRVRGGNFERREGPSSSADVVHLRRVDQPAVEPNRAQSRITKETRQVDDTKTLARTRNGSSAPVSAIMVNRHVSKKPKSAGPLVNVVARTEQSAGREFAPLPVAERISIETKTVSNENVWPSLPPPPKFDITDELAVKEREADGLRRLDQEQRGTLWNA